MNIKRYDVVQVDFGCETVGSEQGGIRPAVVVQNDVGNCYSTTTIVMPLTTRLKSTRQSTHAVVKKSNGLKAESMVLGEQIRVVSIDRIKKKLCEITDEDDKKNIRIAYMANFG